MDDIKENCLLPLKIVFSRAKFVNPLGDSKSLALSTELGNHLIERE
jgi:hypothetical protein